MIHIELECARCRAIFSGATVTSFACPGCGGALVYCSGAPRTAVPVQLCGLCRKPTPCQCDPLTAPIPPRDMQWEPAQSDAATGVSYEAQERKPGCLHHCCGCACYRDEARAERDQMRDAVDACVDSENAARAALVEIRGLALPYAQGTTREAWRAREACRLVDEATDSRAPRMSEDAQREGAGLKLLLAHAEGELRNSAERMAGEHVDCSGGDRDSCCKPEHYDAWKLADDIHIALATPATPVRTAKAIDRARGKLTRGGYAREALEERLKKGT